MDEFVQALLDEDESGESPIPQEFDWYAPLLGDWDFEYTDTYGCKNPGEKRHVRGEWMFRRILEGAGIEDLFICPSRDTRAMDPKPDTEYGVALRMFNANRKCYDMVYTRFAGATCPSVKTASGKKTVRSWLSEKPDRKKKGGGRLFLPPPFLGKIRDQKH